MLTALIRADGSGLRVFARGTGVYGQGEGPPPELTTLLLLDRADELYEDDEFLELEGMTDVGLQIEE